MTTYHIDLKHDWEEQIRGSLVNERRLTVLPRRSGVVDGKSFSLHLGLDDRIVFKTFHKRNFSPRIGSPNGNPFERWTFTTENEGLYIGYVESWGHSDRGARHTPSNVPGVGALISLVNKGIEASTVHAVTLSPSVERHSETSQITPRGVNKPLTDTLFVRRFEDRYAYRGNSIGNQQLSNIMTTWYLNRHQRASAGGALATAFNGAAEIAGRIVGH